MTANEARVAKRRKPLHESIQDMILTGIRSGELVPGQKVVLVDDLAAKWQVSRATVQQSLQVLAAKGFIVRRPRAGTFIAENARDLAEGNWRKTRSICLIIPAIEIPEYAKLARGVEDAADALGLNVIISSTDNQAARYETLLRRQLEAGVGGIFMVPPEENSLSPQLLLDLKESGVPVVTCFRSVQSLVGWPLIRTDVSADMKNTARHLAQVGRRHVSFFTLTLPGDQSTSCVRMGHYGCLRGLLEGGTVPDPEMILVLPASDLDDMPSNAADLEIGAEWRRRIGKWLDNHPEVDGICCGHDVIAAAAIDVIRQRGKRVPEDIAVTGNGHYPSFIGYAVDELTTVAINVRRFGEEFCRMVIQAREGKPLDYPETIEIPGDFIVGRSTVHLS